MEMITTIDRFREETRVLVNNKNKIKDKICNCLDILKENNITQLKVSSY